MNRSAPLVTFSIFEGNKILLTVQIACRKSCRGGVRVEQNKAGHELCHELLVGEGKLPLLSSP